MWQNQNWYSNPYPKIKIFFYIINNLIRNLQNTQTQIPNTQKIENPNPDLNLWGFGCICLIDTMTHVQTKSIVRNLLQILKIFFCAFWYVNRPNLQWKKIIRKKQNYFKKKAHHNLFRIMCYIQNISKAHNMCFGALCAMCFETSREYRIPI